MTDDKAMETPARPNTLRTALVLASLALVLFVGYIARIWIFGK
jgi:hypothetical protein